MIWLAGFMFLNQNIDPNQGFDAVFPLIGALVNFSLFLIGVMSVAMVMFGGVLYMTSTGKPDKTKRALKTIYFAIGGLLLSLSALAIVNFAKGLFPG